MAKYRIVAVPPNFKPGGIFKRRNKQAPQPGQWANANPQIVQSGEEGFDLPESTSAPKAEFQVEQMSPEEQAAYLKNARYQEALASYKPMDVNYKGLSRPTGQLVLAEDYDPDPSKFTNAGYYPIKMESGNYELIPNKDIANIIYEKGVQPRVLSETFGLGNAEDLQKQFNPIYEHAASIHAKRNKEKIDKLINKGYTKDKAIAQLVKEGEGNIEGLTKRYGEYTQAAYDKTKQAADAIVNSSNYSKDLYEKTQDDFSKWAKTNIDKADANVSAWDKWSIQPSESTAVRNNPMVLNLNTGEYEQGDQRTAWEKNEDAKFVATDVRDQMNKIQDSYVDAIKKLALNKTLTDDQKKAIMSDPVKLESLVTGYNEWDKARNKRGADFAPLYQSYDEASNYQPQFKGMDFTSPSMGYSPATTKGDLNIFPQGHTSFVPEKDAKYTGSGRVDMLDEEWLLGVLGVTGLPHAYAAANTLGSMAPISSMPWLNLTNALTAKSVYDTGTEYLPAMGEAIDKGMTEGWDAKTAGEAGYNALKAGFSLVPLSKTVEGIKSVKKAKDVFGTADYGIGLLNKPTDPLTNYKAVKAFGSLASLKKQKGGSIQMELSDDEIKDYVKKGFIVEEVKVSEMQLGGTPSQLWYQYTGTPWSEAKAKGLTDGSIEQNLALAKRLQSGEFGEPKLSTEQYQNVRSGYDDMVANMVRQGQTLDQLVASRVGTREGLKARFPELFSGSSASSSTPKKNAKTPEQIAAEQEAGRQWLIGKAKELGNEVMSGISNSFWGKAAKKVGQATLNYMIEQEKKDRAAKKKQEQAKIKKVETQVKKEVKKVAPVVSEQRPQKTPSVFDVLNKKSIFDYDPLENLKKYAKPVEEKKPAPMTTYDIKGIVDQIQKGQKMGPPPSLTRQQSQQPIANGMGSTFAQGQNIEQINARNKALGITPQNLPEVPSWLERNIADPINETVFGKKDFPTTAEEFIETDPGKWFGKKAYESGLLPKDKEEQLKRKLEKLGEIPIEEESVKIDPNKKIKKIDVKKNAPVTEFTEEIGTSGDGKFLSYRNQWDNKKGFEYITTRDNYDRPDDESYDDVIGVGHYLLDAYIYGDQTYSHKNNQGFLRRAKENNEWIPAFKKTNNNRVLLTYKKPNELTDKDIVVSPLRQYKFNSIDFNNPVSSSSLGYNKNAGIKHLTTKDGDEFKVTFSNPDTYGRHSGASVVFIFKDKFGNTIVRDFAGSLNQIKQEGESIIKDYELKPDDLTIGYHDVASYGAKPKADSSGKLKGNVWKNWNNEPHTGGALIIPRRKNQIASNKNMGAAVKAPPPKR